jgi:hypothetical protein
MSEHVEIDDTIAFFDIFMKGEVDRHILWMQMPIKANQNEKQDSFRLSALPAEAPTRYSIGTCKFSL